MKTRSPVVIIAIVVLLLCPVPAAKAVEREGSDNASACKIGYIREDIPAIKVPTYAGTRYEDKIPDTLDIAERAKLAINALTEATDPNADCEMYWAVHFNRNPVTMHHDWSDVCQPKWMESLELMRIATGSDRNNHVDSVWRRATLKSIGPDGLFYVPLKGRPWMRSATLWGDQVWRADGTTTTLKDLSVTQVTAPFMHGRMIGAMTLYYLHDKDPVWKRTIERMIDGLSEAAIDKEDYAYFPAGVFEPDAKIPDNTDNSLTIGANSFTVDFHVNFTSHENTGSRNEMILVDKLGGPNGPGWSIYSHCDNVPGAARDIVLSSCGPGGTRTWNFGTRVFNLKQWYHMTLTRSGDQVTAYVDGEEQGSPATDTRGANADFGDSGMALGLGCRDADPRDFSLRGGLDDVRLYNRALTHDEIQGISDATVDGGLIGHWKLDAGDDPAAGQTRDELGLHHALFRSGAPPTFGPGRIGNAMFISDAGKCATAATGAPMPLHMEASLVGWIIQGLAQYYEISGYDPARLLAQKLVNYLRYHGQFYDHQGRFISGPGTLANPQHFHHHTTPILGFLEYALVVDDTELMRFVQKSYEWARSAESDSSSLIGYFPENVNSPCEIISCETCEVADMIALALKLSAGGVDDYYADAERWARNHFAEMQLTRTDWIRRFSQSLPKTDAGLDSAAVTADRVPERNLGAFAGWSWPNEWWNVRAPAGIMHCCTGNGVRALYYLWDNILDYEDGCLRVNMLLNRASPWADVHSHIPYQGRVDLRIKQTCSEVLLHAPEWIETNSDKVSAKIDGKPCKCVWQGRYIGLGKVSKDATLSVTFPLTERTVRENIACKPYTLVIRGNTVVHIDPPGKVGPLYQRDHYRKNEAAWISVDRFISDNPAKW